MNLQKAKILIQENIIEQYNVWMGTFNKGRQTKAKQIKVSWNHVSTYKSLFTIFEGFLT